MLLSYQGILRCRYISHGLCIIYDVRAVEHIFRTRVLNLHMSCRNGLPWCLGFQNDRAHTKPQFFCIGSFYEEKYFVDVKYEYKDLASLNRKVHKIFKL